jgi:hypothetical protein
MNRSNDDAASDDELLQSQFRTKKYPTISRVSQTEGHSVNLSLDKLTGNRLPNLSLDAFSKAFPVQLKKACLTQCPDTDDERSFLINLLPVAISWAGSMLENHLVPVFGSNRNDVLSKLEAAGFECQHLPQKVGGTWDYNE